MMHLTIEERQKWTALSSNAGPHHGRWETRVRIPQEPTCIFLQNGRFPALWIAKFLSQTTQNKDIAREQPKI